MTETPPRRYGCLPGACTEQRQRSALEAPKQGMKQSRQIGGCFPRGLGGPPPGWFVLTTLGGVLLRRRRRSRGRRFPRGDFPCPSQRVLGTVQGELQCPAPWPPWRTASACGGVEAVPVPLGLFQAHTDRCGVEPVGQRPLLPAAAAFQKGVEDLLPAGGSRHRDHLPRGCCSCCTAVLLRTVAVK